MRYGFFAAGANNAVHCHVIELETMTRTLHAWVLLCSFSVAVLSPLGMLRLIHGRPGCCTARSCCSSGQCNMTRMDHHPTMPATCSMAKKTHNGHTVEACSCAVSPHAPPLIENPNHTTLAFDPVDYSAPAVILAASPFEFRLSATPLDRSAPPPDHPPRLFS